MKNIKSVDITDLKIKIDELAKNASDEDILNIIEYFHHKIWYIRKYAFDTLIKCSKQNPNIIYLIDQKISNENFKNEDSLYWAIQTLTNLKINVANILIKWAENDNFPKEYLPNIIISLGKIKDNDSIPFLIKFLQNEDWTIKKEAYNAIINFDKTIISQLQNAFSQNENIEVKAWIAKIIGKILGNDSYSYFKNMLESERKEMRYYAICALSENDDLKAISAITDKVFDPSWLIRIQVADILEQKGEKAIEPLKNKIIHGTTDEKFYAIKILKKILKDKTFNLIQNILNISETENKILLLSILAEINDEMAFIFLCDALTENNYLIQRHAANLLINIGDPICEKLYTTFIKTIDNVLKYWIIEILTSINTINSTIILEKIFPHATKTQKIQIIKGINCTGDEKIDYLKVCFLISCLLEKNYSIKYAIINQLLNFSHIKIYFNSEKISLYKIISNISEIDLENLSIHNEQVKMLINSNKFDVTLNNLLNNTTNSLSINSDLSEKIYEDKEEINLTIKSNKILKSSKKYSLTLDEILKLAISHNASDVHFATSYPPTFRINGKIEFQNNLPILESEHIIYLASQIKNLNLEQVINHNKETDISYEIKDLSRFRVNIYMDMYGLAMVFRIIPYKIPTLDEINAPTILKSLAEKQKGLILVTGPTGSGKSTTLAAIINYINQNRKVHIVTIEDPIEFIHKPILAKITQRELNTSTNSFAYALRASLREDPDIILVGEMRDLETIEMAITASETGHLVLSTVHTSSAPNTIDRLIDEFPAEKHTQVRAALAEGLLAIIAQTLVPKKDGNGMVAAFEVLTMTPAIANLIKEGKTTQIKDYMLSGKQLGMQLLDEALAELVSKNEITFDVAMNASSNKEEFKKRYSNPQQNKQDIITEDLNKPKTSYNKPYNKK